MASLNGNIYSNERGVGEGFEWICWSSSLCQRLYQPSLNNNSWMHNKTTNGMSEFKPSLVAPP
ncbi:hypothetical protein M422DRAFT_35501 [Sphaerobolus stellatus SS14]|uniref:Uncharacterized protein n=1 Tax=Sphaerobolus stellatus (strain SS14) TaxID=990650 RepID=A0A0C9V7V0_SPHS4|nr:hypothetical protein M422DRAFT_35501 [Sphaerobolus stellatus SS14]